jgi:hypothetical protein
MASPSKVKVGQLLRVMGAAGEEWHVVSRTEHRADGGVTIWAGPHRFDFNGAVTLPVNAVTEDIQLSLLDDGQ